MYASNKTELWVDGWRDAGLGRTDIRVEVAKVVAR